MYLLDNGCRRHPRYGFVQQNRLTLLLTILVLMFAESFFEFRMFFDRRNAVLAFETRVFISVSDLPRLSLVLHR